MPPKLGNLDITFETNFGSEIFQNNKTLKHYLSQFFLYVSEIWTIRQKGKNRLTLIDKKFFPKNRGVRTFGSQKKLRNYGRNESRTSWLQTKRIQIKLATLCNKNVQKLRGKSTAELWTKRRKATWMTFNPLNAELNPICHLLALLGAHHILHISRIRVK